MNKLASTPNDRAPPWWGGLLPLDALVLRETSLPGTCTIGQKHIGMTTLCEVIQLRLILVGHLLTCILGLRFDARSDECDREELGWLAATTQSAGAAGQIIYTLSFR